MKSIRLISVIVLSFIGVIFENASDRGAKSIFVFVLMVIFGFKLEYEVSGLLDPSKRYPKTYLKTVNTN